MQICPRRVGVSPRSLRTSPLWRGARLAWPPRQSPVGESGAPSDRRRFRSRDHRSRKSGSQLREQVRALGLLGRKCGPRKRCPGAAGRRGPLQGEWELARGGAGDFRGESAVEAGRGPSLSCRAVSPGVPRRPGTGPLGAGRLAQSPAGTVIAKGGWSPGPETRGRAPNCGCGVGRGDPVGAGLSLLPATP